ncbi:MAG: transposase [Chitinophagaceae bacterium]|nr:transposase [Chitinophagaceae bacterium]MCW5927959.1 transposase [Chitinophagaceae bacterium]
MNHEFTGGYKIRDQYGLFFMTFTVVDWIDLFSRQLYRDILVKNMSYCRKHKDLLVGAYVIMTNHMHVIWQSRSGKLSDTVRDYKSFCTKELIEAMQEHPESRREWLLRAFKYHACGTNQNKDYKLWISGSHPEQIYSEGFMRTKLDYIHNNPVRAGWVEKPEDYLYSSASNYATGRGIMEIDYLF